MPTEQKRVNINDMPKWFRAFFVLAPVIGFLLIPTTLDNDFYFLYKTGEHIVQSGFPTTDFLSMHSSMHIIVQQWLSAVIYYFLYSHLGKIGVIGFVYLCYTLLCVVMHRLTKLITHNLFIGSVFAFLADMLAAAMFERTRPQAITILLVLLAVLLLESYVQKKKLIYLALLPVLSLLLINLHAAMWAMLFVFAAPYAAAALPIKIGKIRQEPCCSFVKLLICGVLCLVVGFANPYGVKAMTYIFSSFGYSEINENIIEMQAVSVSDAWGVVLFAMLGIFAALAVFYKHRAFTTRFVLLFGGTALMAFMNEKSIAYFIIGAIPAFSYLLKDAQITLSIDNEKNKKERDNKKITLLTILLLVMLAVLVLLLIPPRGGTQNSLNVQNSEASAAESYEALDDIIALLDKEDKNSMVLYTGFNNGQYFEFYGYHPYIDGRAELFLKDNNGEFDYLSEYIQLRHAQIYYKDFVNKYGFTHLVVNNNDGYFYTSLLHDTDYTVVYAGKDVTLFEHC